MERQAKIPSLLGIVGRPSMQLTDILAIYGAVLSTATVTWNYARTQPAVRVILTYAIETVEGERQVGLCLTIQNRSTQAVVHIANVSLLYPLGKATFRRKLGQLIQFKQVPRDQGWCHCSLSALGIQDRCPALIGPGDSHCIFVRHEVLEEVFEYAESRRLRAAVCDPLWRTSYSKTFEYPPSLKRKGDGCHSTILNSPKYHSCCGDVGGPSILWDITLAFLGLAV